MATIADLTTLSLYDLANSSNVGDKIKKYGQISEFLSSNLCLDKENEQLLIDCLVKDIIEKDPNLKALILEICEFLIKTDKDIIQSLDISKILQITNETGNDDVQNKMQKLLHTVISNCLLEGNVEVIVQVHQAHKIEGKVFKEVCKGIPINKLAFFLMKLVVSLIKQNHAKNDVFLCNIAKTLVNNQGILEELVNNYTDDIVIYIKEYVNYATHMYKEFDTVWYQHSIILIKILFASKLNKRIDLINKILHLLQDIFQNGSSDDKVLAYSCWSELIDSYSLSKSSSLYDEKTMKLLMKPIKIRLCKSRKTIIKRFEVWTKLLLKLGDKYDECIEKYLKFCFLCLKNTEHNDLHGKNIIFPKQLWPKSTEILINMLGHTCIPTSEICFDAYGYTFQSQVISDSFFERHYQVVIESTIECCKLLPFWGNTTTKRLNCLCFSLLKRVDEINDDVAVAVFNVLGQNMKTTIEILETDINQTLEDLVNAVIYYNWNNKCESIFELVFLPAFDIIPTNGKHSSACQEILLNIIDAYRTKCNFYALMKNKLFLDKQATTYISFHIWFTLVTITSDQCLSDEDLGNDCRFIELLTWALQYHNENFNLDDAKYLVLENMINRYFSAHSHRLFKFMKQFAKFNKTYSIFMIQVFSGFIPLLTKRNLTSIGIHLTNILFDILSSPKITKEVQLFKLLEHLSNISFPNEEAITKLLDCIEKFIYPHKNYYVLTVLKKYLELPRVEDKMTASLMSCLYRIDVKFIKDNLLLEILESLKSKKKRNSKRMSPLFNKRPAAQKIDAIYYFYAQASASASPTSTRSVSGIRKSRGRPKRSLLTTPAKPEEDESAKFVLFDEEYEFDPKKMSKHQREILKRRKDDIPALYEDLSRSKSNMYDSSNSTFPELPRNDAEKSDHNPLADANIFKDVANNEIENSKLSENSSHNHLTNTNSDSESTEAVIENAKKSQTTEVQSGEKDLEEVVSNLSNDNQVDAVKNYAHCGQNRNDVISTSYKGSKVTRNTISREIRQLKLDIVGEEDFKKSTKIRAARGPSIVSRILDSNSAKRRPGRPRKKSLNDCNNANDRKSKEVRPDSPDLVENSQEPRQRITSPRTRKTETALEKASKCDDVIPINESLSDMDTLPLTPIGVQPQDRIERNINELNDTTICEMSTLILDQNDRSLSELDTQPVSITPESQVTVRSNCVVKLEQLNDEIIAKLTPPKINLRSSPILDDTPVRISKLIHETNDISPINSETDNSSDTCAKPVSPSRHSASVDYSPKSKTVLRFARKPPNARVEMLENLRPKTPAKISEAIKSNNTVHVSSPHSARIRKLITTCETVNHNNNNNNNTDNQQKDQIPDDANKMESSYLLTFSKTLPDSEATPKSSILKRKLPDVPTEGLSPLTKKKRVNFSDPPTTSEKVYEVDISDSDTIDHRLKLIFDTCNSDSNKDTDYDPQNHKPICPDFVDDKADLVEILNYLYLKKDVAKNAKELHKVNVKCVGDFARLDEIDIVKLPVVFPKTVSIINAFKLYENAKKKSASSSELEMIDGVTPLEATYKENQLQEVLRLIKADRNLTADDIIKTFKNNTSDPKLIQLVKTIKDFLT